MKNGNLLSNLSIYRKPYSQGETGGDGGRWGATGWLNSLLKLMLVSKTLSSDRRVSGFPKELAWVPKDAYI